MNVKERAGRIEELGNKSSQILLFLSFAIVAAVTLSGACIEPSKKLAVNQAMRWWVRAVFPTVLGIVPLKEFCWECPRWYCLIGWFKFALLWGALICIVWGAWWFLRAV
jgi:hypothetical protein